MGKYEYRNLAALGGDRWEMARASSRGRTPGRHISIRSVLTLGGGTTVAQLIVLGTTPFISRVYSPEAIGIYTLFFTFVNFVHAGSSLMYSAAVPAARDNRDASALLALSLRLLYPYSVAGALLFLGLTLSGRLGFDSFPPLASGAAGVCLIFAGAFTTLRFALVRHQKYAQIARAVMLQSGVRSFGQIGAGLLAPTWWSMAVADILGRACGSIPGFSVRGANAESQRHMFEVVSLYRRYPLVYLPSVFINNLVVWLPLPLVITQYGAAVGGLYAIVSRVVAVPMTLVASSIADVYHGSVAETARDGRDPRPLFWSTAALLAGVGAIVALLVAFAAGPLLPWVLGHQWAAAGPFCAAVAPWLFFQFVVNPLSRIIVVFDGQRQKLIYDLFSLGATMMAFFASIHFNWDAVSFVMALSVANSAAYLVYFGVLARLVAKGRKLDGAREHESS